MQQHRVTLADLQHERLRREKARRDRARIRELVKPLEESLATFAREAWPIVEPGRPLVWGWHLDAIAEHLQAVTEGRIRSLIINVPPRHTKSLFTAVLWPAWEWARDPSVTWLFASYAQVLSTRDSVKMRRLIESPWYRQRFPQVTLTDDQNQKMRYETTHGGHRISTSVGGAATGDGGRRRVVDDPHSVQEAHSDTKREAALEWWRETFANRQIDPETDADVVIMQRLHERDLSGFILDDIGGFEHLMLPARFETERRCVTSIGWADPREKDGELLAPTRFTPAALAQLELRLGQYGTEGQLQQRPAPTGGGILKAHWFRYWQPIGADLGPVRVKDASGDWLTIEPVTLPNRPADQQLQSWDMSFKSTETSSRVAGQVWAQWGADAYLLDIEWDAMTFSETLAAVRRLSARHPDAYRKIVEDKANGPAVIDVLKSELGGFIPAQPHGSKEARAHAVSPRIEAGNVYLPHPRHRPWVDRLRTAISTFPAGSDSDPVDALTQALAALPATPNTYASRKTASARAGARR